MTDISCVELWCYRCVNERKTEDTKEVNKHKKDKMTNNSHKTLQRQLKMNQLNTNLIKTPEMNAGDREW